MLSSLPAVYICNIYRSTVATLISLLLPSWTTRTYSTSCASMYGANQTKGERKWKQQHVRNAFIAPSVSSLCAGRPGMFLRGKKTSVGTTPVGGKRHALGRTQWTLWIQWDPSSCLTNGGKHVSTDLTMGPSCKMCNSRMSGLSLLRSRWMKVRVSCTSTDGTSVKRSVSPCQIWSPAERYVELRYSAAVVSAVNRDTDTKMELGNRILTHSAIWGMRRAASLRVCTSITKPPSRRLECWRNAAAGAAACLRYVRQAGQVHSQVLSRGETAGGARSAALSSAHWSASQRDDNAPKTDVTMVVQTSAGPWG